MLILTLLFHTAVSAQVCWISGPPFIVGEGSGVHANESPVLAIQDIMFDSIAPGNFGTAKFFIEDLKLKVQFNKSSVGFFNAFRSGQRYISFFVKFWYQKPDATFAVWTNIELQDAIVTGYKILAPECNNGPSCNIPLLELSLNWRKMIISDAFGNTSILDKQQLGL
jgi:type VI protein secretion system component Hcp